MECRKKNLDDKIFRFIYIEAMRDAVLQLSFKGDKKWLTESDELFDSLMGEIELLIDKVISGEFISKDEYNEWFLSTAINICKCINKKTINNEFTFGNAQKLINIMLKYFYILSYKNDSLKERFKFCHCPMDRQLLMKVWSKRAELDDIMLGKYEDFLKSWGNEDFEKDENDKKIYPRRYLLFQQAVCHLSEKKNMSPLEYDYYEWKSL